MRVHRPVAPKSFALAMAMKPARAASLASAGIASSRLPSTHVDLRGSAPAPWRGPSRRAAARNGSCARAAPAARAGRRRADGERLKEAARQLRRGLWTLSQHASRACPGSAVGWQHAGNRSCRERIMSGRHRRADAASRQPCCRSGLDAVARPRKLCDRTTGCSPGQSGACDVRPRRAPQPPGAVLRADRPRLRLRQARARGPRPGSPGCTSS